MLILITNADCWKQDPHDRPTFKEILSSLVELSNSEFAFTNTQSFSSMRNDWKIEIDQIWRNSN